MSWDECPLALKEGFSILPILETKEFNSRLCPLQQRQREHSERDEGAPVPQWKWREPVCQRTLIKQYAFSSRKVDWRVKRKETTRDC